MGAAEWTTWAIAQATHELALFAAIGIAIGGIDDLIVDLIWLGRTAWRRMAVYTRYQRADAGQLSGEGRVAVFVPAWREAAVIGPMLETALARWRGADCRIYVGCYPNDPDTLAAVEAVAARNARVRLVLNPRRGPTTKAHNLNAMWRALLADEAGAPVVAVALHDAEDVVHPAEIGIYATLCGRCDLVQLPVLPLIERERGWWARAVSSSYADEFAESHGKQLTVREAIGAGVPSAGVGCGFSRAALGRIAERHGAPFDEGSVTEDYELACVFARWVGGAFLSGCPERPAERRSPSARISRIRSRRQSARKRGGRPESRCPVGLGWGGAAIWPSNGCVFGIDARSWPRWCYCAPMSRALAG